MRRRQFMRWMAAAGATAHLPRLVAQPESNTRLPSQREWLLRGGHVLSMDPTIGDLPVGDVHVRGGRIVAVGERLSAPDATVIDAGDQIVLPGFVETHWHIWTTMLRSMSGDVPEHGYFPTSRTIGAAYLASDMFASARLALAEAIHSGITFVHDWCHNVRSPEYAEAALRALAESGIRGRFSYGAPAGQPSADPIDRSDLARLAGSWPDFSADGRLQLGLAWRGTASPASIEDGRVARELGLPLSVHVSNSRSTAGGIRTLAEAGLLGPDVQLIHAIWASPEEISAVAASGASVTVSPFTELRIGFGMPKTGEFLDAGVPVGLSVDTPALSGNADMFAIMKVIQNVENGRTLNEVRLPARRVLELATIEGARSIGVSDQTGSLTPGKRADLIMIDTRDINLGVVAEPTHAIVEAAQPSNVSTVFVDGRLLKHEGRLTAVDPSAVIADARTAAAAARRRAGWW